MIIISPSAKYAQLSNHLLYMFVYTLSQKTTLVLHTTTSTHLN